MQDKVIPSNAQTESQRKFDVVKLPSEGKFYPAEHPLHNEEYIEIYYMTASEEDILTSQNLLQSGKVLDVLLANSIRDRSIDASSLLVGDRNAILMWLRVTGYGSEYPVSITCSECGNMFKHEFDLSQITVKEASVGGENLTLDLPASGKTVKFKLLNGYDEASMTKAMAKRTKNNISTNVVTTMMKLSIIDVDGETDKAYIHKFIASMPIGDSIKFRRHLENVQPGLDMKQEATCPTCDMAEGVDVPMTAQFFWPDSGA